MYKDVSQNPADYYLFDGSTLAYIECKETGEGTLNFSKFPQLDRMLEKIQYKNVQAYVLIWFRSKQRVVILSAQEADKIRQDGHKSIALAMLEKKSYNIIEIPATFPRTYPVCDWSKLVEVIKNDR
jgi:penicillin-binding protein-related factor A (putative recombinase)